MDETKYGIKDFYREKNGQPDIPLGKKFDEIVT